MGTNTSQRNTPYSSQVGADNGTQQRRTRGYVGGTRTGYSAHCVTVSTACPRCLCPCYWWISGIQLGELKWMGQLAESTASAIFAIHSATCNLIYCFCGCYPCLSTMLLAVLGINLEEGCGPEGSGFEYVRSTTYALVDCALASPCSSPLI